MNEKVFEEMGKVDGWMHGVLQGQADKQWEV